MSKIKLNWITGKRLLKRWNIDIRELDICIKSGLPVYNPDFKLEEWGPIYTKLPNPDYKPKDVLSEKYIINKNNLHDFQVLLDSAFPVKDTGLTKDQILNNLLFKLEDVENYEKEYGLNKNNGIPLVVLKDNQKGSEFDLYDSIVNGELRPFLKTYSSKSHIEDLMKKLWSISFIKDEDGFKTSPEYDDELDEIFAKPGDIVELSFDETDGQPRFTLTNETEDYLEELYDLDIPPPPDLKAEYFLDLITLEYEKIKLRANKALQTSYNEEELSLFVNKNVQRLKKIAAQAHLLSRRLRTKDQSILDDPDSYIILILKIYLIRSICFYQDLFKPYLKVPVKDKFELRTSLYGEKHPTVIIREWEERDRNNLYKRLSGEINRLKNDGNDNNLDQQIHSLKNLTLNENWLKTVAEDAVSNGFIGKSHLVFIMASDKSYAKNLILTQLIENMFSEIKERKDHYWGFRDLSTSDYKSRIDVWSELIGHWVKGNYKFYKDKYKNYLPLYCLDLTTKDLHRFDPEQKNCQVRSEGRVENCYVIRYASQFIKLSELKKYMVDVLRIPPPSALFPDNELFNLDGEKQILIEKLRPSQKSKNECRKIAKKIWGKNPQITIADMINHKDLLPYTTKKNGDLYAEKTVRNWIKDLCPDRSRGRRKST